MADSVAPKERINIVYKPATGDKQEERELPLKLAMIGDYTLRPDERPLEERKPVSVDKDNFNEVMSKHELALSIKVPDRISDKDNPPQLVVDLNFNSLRDFSPDSVVRQVPALNQLLEIREALKFLRGPLGNKAAFKRKIEGIVKDTTSRKRLLKELGIEDDAGSASEA